MDRGGRLRHRVRSRWAPYGRSNSAPNQGARWAGVAGGSMVARAAAARFARNLDWGKVNHAPFLKAGMRGGSRGLDEARRAWETLPEQVRATGSDLTGLDWSHKTPHARGGSSAANNGVFEAAGKNRARGDRPMTPKEIRDAERALRGAAVRATVVEACKAAGKAALIAAAVEAVFAVLEEGLRYCKGEITKEELAKRVAKQSAQAGMSGAMIGAALTAVAIACPATIPFVAASAWPLAVAGTLAQGSRAYKALTGWRKALWPRVGDLYLELEELQGTLPLLTHKSWNPRHHCPEHWMRGRRPRPWGVRHSKSWERRELAS